MHWEDIEKPWQVAFEQVWEAFKSGSLPIGAAIADENGEIISVGRNRLYEHGRLNPKIAHAELECLLNLDVSKFPNLKQYTLYATCEPCPMCFGTIVMSNIRKVKVAARDSWCGAVHYKEIDPYIKSKSMQVEFAPDTLEIVQLVILSYCNIQRDNGKINPVVELFFKDSPAAKKITMDFYEKRYLDYCIDNNIGMSTIFNTIVSEIE